MKIFEQGNKTNFVDENNVLLGYDTYQCCCENAGWFIDDVQHQTISDSNDVPDLTHFVFDTSFFEMVDGNDFDSGGMAIFRIVDVLGGKEKFIHIYNAHNGYYSHGFRFSAGESVVQDGSL